MLQDLNHPLWHAWAKARPARDALHAWHPLVYHCLDVAAVGEALARQQTAPLERLAVCLGSSAEPMARFFAFLLALHDIGKLSRAFQAKAPEVWWPTSLLGVRGGPQPRDPGHPVTGAWLLRRGLSSELTEFFPQWSNSDIDQLLAPVVGHHGKPVADLEIAENRIAPRELFGQPCLEAARSFLALMRELFLPQPVRRAEGPALRSSSWSLAGLAVLADWIGSRQTWFPYAAPDLDPRTYLADVARPRAAEALTKAGITPARASVRTGYRTLAGDAHQPSPIQRWAETVEFPKGPFLVFVEDVTGGGKTEAALILAHRLLARGRVRGLYLALPTMATANAMYDRLAASYRRLFAEKETPSLTLAHGSARLHEGFRESFEGVADPERASEREDDPAAERDPSGAACAAWLADDRRKAFLADIGVGTIDQAFFAVLPSKYQALRLLGLAERALIVDEAHAYDAYMGRELERLLEFHAALGGSAIVLSATLPHTVRGQLAAAFAKGLTKMAPAIEERAYPLVSIVDAAGAREQGMDPRPVLRRTLEVERLPDAAPALARIAEAASAGAAIAWVRNTVDDAFDGIAQLQAAGVTARLFHARFAMGDRLAVEREIVGRFGKGNPPNRPGVLVATQVIEQSLDLDFDLVVSDLAPIDLLLQRAGRLWRHPERRRPVAGPRLLVVSPDPAAEIGNDWYAATFPRAAWVYKNHALLWLSATALFGRASVRVPEDVRALVEAVYSGADPDCWAPPALRGNVIKAQGEAQAARALAQTNLLSVTKGYGDSADHAGWDLDTRTPTRLGEEMTTLRLALFENGRLVPWCPDPDPHRAWALSEVAVRKNRVTDVLEPAAAAALKRREWTRYDEPKKLLLLTERQPGVWQGMVTSRDGETSVVYTRRKGLRFGATV